MEFIPSKSELVEYKYSDKEIAIIESQINSLEIQHDCVKGSNDEFPYNAQVFHIYGRNHKDYENLRKLLESQLARRIKLRIKIENWLLSLDDVQMRIIVRMRYLDNKSWLEISRVLGADYPEYAQIIHDRYLKKEEC